MTHKSRIKDGQRVPCGTNPGRWDQKLKIASAKAAKAHAQALKAKPKKKAPMHGRQVRLNPERDMTQKAGIENAQNIQQHETKEALKHNIEHKSN